MDLDVESWKWKYQSFAIEFIFSNTAKNTDEQLSEQEVRIKIRNALLASGIGIDYIAVTEK
jgi:hypothetical protein